VPLAVIRRQASASELSRVVPQNRLDARLIAESRGRLFIAF
jgi:hypothetical protein